MEDFSPDADLRGRVVRATLWARRHQPSNTHAPSNLPNLTRSNEKGKGRATDYEDASLNGTSEENEQAQADQPEWKALNSWEVNLEALQPLAPDVCTPCTSLSSSELVAKL